MLKDPSLSTTFSFPPSFSLILRHHFVSFFPLSALLFPLLFVSSHSSSITLCLAEQQRKRSIFVHFQTVGLKQKRINFLLAKFKFKPICSCTKFLYPVSWLQGEHEWEWDGVTQSPCQPQSCAATHQGGHRGCAAGSGGQAEGWSTGDGSHLEVCLFRYVAASSRPFSRHCPHLCPCSTS